MRKFRWSDLVMLPFGVCVLFLLVLGKLFGLTYKQISVVFNLWIQGAALSLTGLAPAAACVYKLAAGGSLLWLAATVPLMTYAAVYVYGIVKMLRHYHLPFDDAFDLCVEDLQRLAVKWRTSYQMVNIIIFVLLFLVLITINLLLTHQIIYL